MLWWATSALATPAFVPVPEARYEGAETYTQDGALKLWSAVERYRDVDETLFHQESFNEGLMWRDADTSPFIATMFGDATPESGSFLMHRGLNASVATGTPVLLVHGAGDNGSRAFVTLATRLDRSLRPVFAVTFAHPHGDLFLQAEVVADALAVVTAATGSEAVDVVAHSKGGIASALYASNHAGATWSDAAYVSAGTRYRGDIRRLVLVATPLGGVDTAYRWPGLNLFATDADTAVSPTSWTTWFPSTVVVWADQVDLADQDLHPDGADLFPGQRQLLRAQPPALPGATPWLGLYALQPDWYTTWHGGLGLVSDSRGIEAAVADGADLIGQIAAAGVDPAVALYLLAGSSPILPNGSDALADGFAALASGVDFAALALDVEAHGAPCHPGAYELAGLESGALVLGEITGPSDGLVFVDSALAAETLTGRGAEVVEDRVVDLSHLDLLYASPVTGALLVEAGAQDPDVDGWMIDVGHRYEAADTLGWIEAALADAPAAPEPTDTAEPADADRPAVQESGPRPCGGCDSGRPNGWMGLLATAFWTRGVLRHRRPRSAASLCRTSPRVP
jgi:hypothetical protein